jgi:hypothetical protein
LTSLEVRVTNGETGRGNYFYADTMLFGLRSESISDEGNGHALALGTSVGVRYQREKYDAWHDRFGAAHLPGLAVDANFYGSNWALRTSGRIHGDYVGVHAMNYHQWQDAYPDETGKTVLAREGYHYGWGLSGRLKAELAVSRFGIGASAFYGQYRSQQNFDRLQEMITRDQVGLNRLIDYEAWLRAQLYGTAFVEVRRTGNYRRASLDEFSGRNQIVRNTIEIGTYF